MRGAGKFIFSVGSVSVLMLLYVHLNVSLFSFSYGINQKSKRFDQRNKDYRQLKYEVEVLKAPYRLAAEIRQRNLELDLPKEIRVVKVPVPQTLDMETFNTVTPHPLSKGFLDYLGRWVKVAQAKMDS